MKKLLLTAFLLSTFLVSGQVNFEPGYLIDNQGTTKRVLIKNYEWLDSPSNFEYKESENSSIAVGTLKTIQEFGIENGVAYKKATVQIDKSSDKLESLSYQMEPEFEEQTLFLRKIISGNVSLYVLNGLGAAKYFYNFNNQPIEPLIYKRYRIKDRGGVFTNNTYKQSLSNDFKCKDIAVDEFANLDYKDRDLISLFIKYNKCTNSEIKIYDRMSAGSKAESKFKLRVKAGMRFNSFSFGNSGLNNEKFSGEVGPQLGLEGEFVFKFNRNKWSALLSATYFSFSNEKIIEQSGFNQPVSIDYSAIEMSAGVRHSLFINNSSRIFISGHYIVPININQSFKRTVTREFDTFVTLSNLGAGLGYEYNDLSLEFTYQGSRTLINGLNSEYSNYALTIGYSFL